MALIGTVGAMAFVSVRAAIESFSSDAAMRRVQSAIRQARDAAIAQRRSIDLVFESPNRIQLLRNEIPDGQTVFAEYTLASEMEYERGDRPDTPDAFGGDGALAFGDAGVIRFVPDGTLVDEDGILLNGTIFLARANDPSTARAVTVTGGSGRAQGYVWAGDTWEAR